MTKRKQWARSGWSVKQEDALAAIVEGVEGLAAQVAGLIEQVENVDIRLAALEEAGGEGAAKRKTTAKGGEHRDVLGRHITNERRGATRRVAKPAVRKSKKPAEVPFSFRPSTATATFKGVVPAALAAAMRGAESPVEHDPDRDPWGRYRPGRSVPERDQRGRAVRR